MALEWLLTNAYYQRVDVVACRPSAVHAAVSSSASEAAGMHGMLCVDGFLTKKCMRRDGTEKGYYNFISHISPWGLRNARCRELSWKLRMKEQMAF